MKIEINTNARAVELANYVIAQVVDILKNSDIDRKNLGIKLKDVEKVEVFRRQLLKGFFKGVDKNQKLSNERNNDKTGL